MHSIPQKVHNAGHFDCILIKAERGLREGLAQLREAETSNLSAHHNRRTAFLHSLNLRKMWSWLALIRQPATSSGIPTIWKSCFRRQLSTHDPAKIRKWTADEDRKLLQLRQQGLKLGQIAREMDNRTHGGVDQRIRTLRSGLIPGQTPGAQPAWSTEEDALLQAKLHQGLTYREIAECFPRRNANSILHRIKVKAALVDPLSFAKRRQTRVTEDDIKKIIHMRLNEAKSCGDIALELDRSLYSITRVWDNHCVRRLSQDDIDSIRRQRNWTPKEVKHLLQLHRRGKMLQSEIALHFPSKTLNTVRIKIVRLQLNSPESKQQQQSLVAEPRAQS